MPKTKLWAPAPLLPGVAAYDDSFLVKVSSSTASTNDLKIRSYFLPFTAGLTLAHQAEVHHVQSPAVKERENSLA